MSSDFSEFHAAFFEESFDAIESMEQSLLILETDAADPDAINTIFRGAHSMCWAARACWGFQSSVNLPMLWKPS